MANFKKIYTGDYSKEGYDSGIDDGKKGSAKWGGFKFFKAVNPINYVWNFNNAFDSFTQNYNKAYLDGQRVEHGVYTSQTKQINTTGGNMEQNSYEYHLALLEGVKRNLNALKVYMSQIEEKYDKQIKAMASAGFNSNYINPLTQRYAQFQQKMSDLQDMIEQHEQIIGKHENKLEQLIQGARR